VSSVWGEIYGVIPVFYIEPFLFVEDYLKGKQKDIHDRPLRKGARLMAQNFWDNKRTVHCNVLAMLLRLNIRLDGYVRFWNFAA
jgi:hypothetical protein